VTGREDGGGKRRRRAQRGGAERSPAGRGAPPLRPFGLVLHRDGRWTHEGVPVTHPKLRALFDRSVRYLPEEDAYVVQVGRFRGQIEVEEAPFFVREYDAASGTLRLSDRSREPLRPETLRAAPDGALLCDVKADLRPGGCPARFSHAAQAQLLLAVEDAPEGPRLSVGDRRAPLPPL